jgi:hypothetical protein
MVYGIPDEAVAIIKQAQPYHWGDDRGRHEIALLNAMWNHDKHRLLHATGIVLGQPRPPIVRVGDVAEILKTSYFTPPLEDNAEVVWVTIRPDGPDPKLKMDGKFAVGVAFAEGVKGVDLKGLHVIAVLRNALQAVTWLVGSIEAACQNPSRP